jgi:cytidylate kinase
VASAVVTLSATYGAGGSEVGPALAERLGVTFVDRAIPTTVAERLSVPLDEALAHDESLGDAIGRLSSSFALLPELAGAMVHADLLAEEDYRRETERAVREAAATGAVVLGRAGQLILRGEPGALHVRLDGPPERRLEQAMRLEGVDKATAERHMRETDRARQAYVQHFYAADPRDCGLYHLVIDSTAIPLDGCVELIAHAAQVLAAAD